MVWFGSLGEVGIGNPDWWVIDAVLFQSIGILWWPLEVTVVPGVWDTK